MKIQNQYDEEYLEEEDPEVCVENLEETVLKVVDKLNSFEGILQNIAEKIKIRYTTTSASPAGTSVFNFPLQTIAEISQFQMDDDEIDSVVKPFIKDLLNQHKNFSVLFKHLCSDQLILLFSDWEKMSQYRFFSDILYGNIFFFFVLMENFLFEHT